jgi:hypothetical protein
MGLFSGLKIFGKKKPDLTPIPMRPLEPFPIKPITQETAGMDNVKAKVDLVLTQLENLKVQNETLNERLKNLERDVGEILSIAKSEVNR